MNADNKLNFIQRINWMVKAFIAYILDIFVPLKAKRIMNIKMSRFISIETASPTRMFTENLIYEYIPWKTHKQEFGEIFICEFGCGDLRYLDLYDQVLGKSGYRYLGLEAPGFKLSEEAKRKLSSKVKFINHDLNSGVPIEVNQCNVFLSFSVLEHIDNLDIFINSYGKSQKSPSIHYHSVPTFLSVLNYLWHGCRHFNKSNINSLFEGFKANNTKVIYYGGLITIILHAFFITTADIIKKIFKTNERPFIKNEKIARSVVLKFQSLDNITALFGIHSFCLVSWVTKEPQLSK